MNTKKILSAICMMVIAFTGYGQTKRMAVTALSENMMRLNPDYESPLETQALMGTIVEIIGEESYWRQVVTPEPYTAWCTNLGLVEMTAEQINEYKAAPKYICTVQHSGVYETPSVKSRRLSDLSMGNLLRIVYKEGKKVKPSVKKKWAEVMLPDGRKGWTPATDLKPFAEWAGKQKLTAENIVSTAMQFEGTPYLWGGASSKGLDCSGLVRLTFMMNGHLLPRNASQQVNHGREIIMECDHSITPDSDKLYQEMLKRTKNLQPGDLVFFGSPETFWSKEKITHVGIYIGNGRIIHASHKVRVNSLIPGEKDYYENSHRLLKARRFINWQGPGMIPIIQSPAYFLW
ncbi:MAG: C40 family peptidase [Bacteroidales bacterium]|nr:C40 family peptidase [Bacteroidales bacterium]